MKAADEKEKMQGHDGSHVPNYDSFRCPEVGAVDHNRPGRSGEPPLATSADVVMADEMRACSTSSPRRVRPVADKMHVLRKIL